MAVAGPTGLVGSTICRRLEADSVEFVIVSRAEAELTDQRAVSDWFGSSAIDELYLAAAHVGGIQANDTYPVGFIRNALVYCPRNK